MFGAVYVCHLVVGFNSLKANPANEAAAFITAFSAVEWVDWYLE